jgi:xanthine dehydrogenase iron-sulfur cluster and FAD-binding subunit A
MAYFRPQSINDAIKVLKENNVKIIAGGTDTVVRMEKGFIDPDNFMDISWLKLNEISLKDNIITIGALVTMSQLSEHPLITKYLPLLSVAAQSVGAPQIRNRATIGGNIVNASPAADGACAVSCYEGEIVYTGEKGEKTASVSKFITGVGKTILKSSEFVTAIKIDVSKPEGCKEEILHWLKMGNRNAQVISMVAMAGRTLLDENGEVIKSVISVGSIAPTTFRAYEVEDGLKGKKLNDDVIKEAQDKILSLIKPITDLRATAQYRKHIVSVFLKNHLKNENEGKIKSFEGDSNLVLENRKSENEEGDFSVKINGKDFLIKDSFNLRVLDYLRDELNFTGTKNGCGEGECGACTILLNGKSVNACMVLTGNVAGQEITTIEGIGKEDGSLGLVQQAFVDKGAVQCGFCIPGFEISAHEFVVENEKADRKDILKAVSGNLCRCTGYIKIVEAIELAMERKGEVE